ncbi:MAG: hypothetical protein Q9220_007083 [cf. Caloplaca sp. 1 TL-2023]
MSHDNRPRFPSNQNFFASEPQQNFQNQTFQSSPRHSAPQFQSSNDPQLAASAFAPPSPPPQPPTPHSRADDPRFDIFDWFPKYQSCQRYFIDHAQQSGPVQALAAFINIQLPLHRSPNPVSSSQARSPPSPGGLASLNFGSTARSPGGTANPSSSASNLTFMSISLIPYLRRLVVTGLDFPGVLHGFFGDDWASGVGPLHEQERRNFLFAAKSGGWASVKKDYDMGPTETVPFMRPLQAAVAPEIEAAEKTWSEWLAMEDWMVGPRAPEGMQGQQQSNAQETHARGGNHQHEGSGGSGVLAAEGVCNGHAELCARKYSDITFLAAHDSPFVGSSLADNQDIPVTEQLDAGIRFLSAQTHASPFGTLNLCHTSCFLMDAGTLTSYLSTINDWLDMNRDEVLTLLLTNGDRTDISAFDAAFKAAQLDTSAYIPPQTPLPIASWPTLGDLIDAGTRLIVFLDYNADPTRVPYILDEFAYFFETPYDTTDPAFNQCAIDRPPGATAEGRMYIVNHYLDKKLGDDMLVPDREAVETVNGEESIGAQVALCEGMYGRKPNVVMLDFVGTGDGVQKVQGELNGY